ncbi:hypothetical protein [Povalibacter sp.]|uniref:hypothetical protein n=1 Tax=Povalibacter sp. TaxID=1962978 RepID=UPI002F40F767
MLNTLREFAVEIGCVTPLGHSSFSSTRRHNVDRRYWWSTPLCALALVVMCKVHAQSPASASSDAGTATVIADCLPDGSGYVRARLKGSIDRELDWGNTGTGCTGAVRPTDGGIRVRFTGSFEGQSQLVLVFGISGLREGATATLLPVNVTVIREGSGEFYSTQGDDKCTLDRVTQKPLIGIPDRSRVYRIEARGFCTEPARALNGKGSILISRFDFAGRVDFDDTDSTQDPHDSKAAT